MSPPQTLITYSFTVVSITSHSSTNPGRRMKLSPAFNSKRLPSWPWMTECLSKMWQYSHSSYEIYKRPAVLCQIPA